MGFTEVFLLTFQDWTSTVIAPETIVLTPLAVGDLVGAELMVDCTVPFSGMGFAILTVGVTGMLDYFIAPVSLLGTDPIYRAAGAGVAPYLALAATNLVATMDFVDSPPSVAAQGEMKIWARISRRARRILQA